jgi:hypothetical protein
MMHFQLRHLLMLTSPIALMLAAALPPAVSVAQRPPAPVRILFTPPPPPPDIGEPEDRGQGGGSRGDACERYVGMMALVPSANPQALPWGLTIAERPTIWLYAPQGLAAAVPLEFVLQDQMGETRHRTLVRAPEMPAGVFSLSVRDSTAPLAVGQSYRWSVSIYCDPEAPDVPIVVQGNLERVAPPAHLQSQLAVTQDAIDQAALYAQHGIWYDALTTLAEQRTQTEDAAIVTVWSDLLGQVNLGEIAPAAIVPCCRSIEP